MKEVPGRMKRVDIDSAKKNLSKLVDKAAKGEFFVITKAGRPLVKVVALDSPLPRAVRRLGFIAKQIRVPEDFDQMGDKEIGSLFDSGKS